MYELYDALRARASAPRQPDSSESDNPSENPGCPEKLKDLDITFDDIAGHEATKATLQTLYILPREYPNLFRTAAKGLLLYGPPGTGKTTFAKAAVAELGNERHLLRSELGRHQGEVRRRDAEKRAANLLVRVLRGSE
jgi:SpoVK/Ycf46/Vps4 family AAA+-type ATPase